MREIRRLHLPIRLQHPRQRRNSSSSPSDQMSYIFTVSSQSRDPFLPSLLASNAASDSGAPHGCTCPCAFNTIATQSCEIALRGLTPRRPWSLCWLMEIIVGCYLASEKSPLSSGHAPPSALRSQRPVTMQPGTQSSTTLPTVLTNLSRIWRKRGTGATSCNQMTSSRHR